MSLAGASAALALATVLVLVVITTQAAQAQTFTVLYSFDNFAPDGFRSYAGLVQATDGDLYGTTWVGGANDYGTVFKITPSGTLTNLHSFDDTDGANPDAGLIQATNGDFYGITPGGGANGEGTVFKITHSGTFTTLYSFCSQTNCTDGESPGAGLVQASNEEFYGTTRFGGANDNGTVFKMTAAGTLTTLHSFDSTDGANPAAALIQATNGNFYGTTPLGGANTYGTIFKITASGTLTTLYSFCPQSGCPDGAEPYAGLVQATNGTFYGTTYQGASADCFDGCGDVFSLSVGLGPFVETQTSSGKVGAAVKILGTNLTGATSVTFNGTSATFTVVSKSEITATVPTGATTGTVEVTTPRGTLKSNTQFRVTP
jgi:uncharacterized repeat protein (TIGR03803 family)